MQIFCACLYETVMVDDSRSTLTTVLEFLFSALIGICGVKINYRFIQELKEEKRNTPLGRKGNVIEPIMRWFLWFQIIYWPYYLFLYWISVNEIIPSKDLYGWQSICFWQIGLKLGRLIICFNSLFIALIRYIYIVHGEKANLLDFKKVGKWMALSSFVIPTALETIGILTTDYKEFPYSAMTRFQECIDNHQNANNTHNSNLSKPIMVAWTLHYLPQGAVRFIYYTYYTINVVVMFSAAEGFLYLKMYQNVKR